MGTQLENEMGSVLVPYTKPIFGFALNRTGDRQEAEDLSQEIFLQLLKSMSSGRDIQNLDGYVWTVARFTWVNWLNRRRRTSSSLDLNGMSELPSPDTPNVLEQIIQSDEYKRLRQEIAYLSQLQRKIVVMHYYDGKKQSDVAVELGIPVGTVKWHLHDARQELKKGMVRMRSSNELSFNPVQFVRTGHSGTPGKMGETYTFMRRSIAQNLMYAMYHKPKTIQELARDLGTPAAFIEDEVEYLEEYGYVIEAGSGKYAANMIIWNFTDEQRLKVKKLYRECASLVADQHFDALMDIRSGIEQSDLYVPDKDYHFLLWTLLPMNIGEQGRNANAVTIDREKALPFRKDGGRYIATAHLNSGTLSTPHQEPDYYVFNGAMTRDTADGLYLWQFNTFWSDRVSQGWANLTSRDVQKCHAYWSGSMDEETQKEDYAFLLERGYLRKDGNEYTFNTIWVDKPATAEAIRRLMPDLSNVYAPAIASLYEQALLLAMQNQPKHLEQQIAYMTMQNTNAGQLVPYVLKHLLDNRKLREPEPHQSKTITTWMGLCKETTVPGKK
ncbi:RNA polymerase sigma factor [Paenibacillus hodogayensis]|uniref:RNA polymerase sigma factor n=1 Tax=Paenibacillus hodogayensis TaxID=279208 RepID=A0ABV5VUT5_9BACL